MKTLKLNILILILLSVSVGYGQKLITTKNSPASAEILRRIEKKFAPEKSYRNFTLIELNLTALKQDSEIEIELFDERLTVKKLNHIIRGDLDYSWFGIHEDGLNIVGLAVKGNEVIGQFQFKNFVYVIETVGTEYVLVKLDGSEVNSKLCGMIGSEPSNEINQGGEGTKNKNTIESDKSIAPFVCKIRILVLVTPAANIFMSDRELQAQFCIDQLNTSFMSSGINAEAELVKVHLTNYTEINAPIVGNIPSDNDLSRFVFDNDGYMDEVHDLRDDYSADFCLLLGNFDAETMGFKGISRTIKASSVKAFAYVHYFYSFVGYSFIHEIGHLMGCRHEAQQDGDMLPFSYGHGYYNDNVGGIGGIFKTIMAVGCVECQRSLRWSNPDLTTPFGPTGDAYSNNARVINESLSNIMSLRPNNGVMWADRLKIERASTSNNQLYNSNIINTTNDAYLAANESRAFYAGERVIFEPGFYTGSGANLLAEIVDPCGYPDDLPDDYGQAGDIILGDLNVKDKIEGHYFTVFPNPVNDQLQIKFNFDCNVNLKIDIYDFQGRKIKSVLEGVSDIDDVGINCYVGYLSKGFYFITISDSASMLESIRFEKID